MKYILTALFVFGFLYQLESAPVIRGIAPNHAVRGEQLTVQIAAENSSSEVAQNEISFGAGVRVLSILKQNVQTRQERRILFLEIEIVVDTNAVEGERNVTVAGSRSTAVSRFYIRSTTGIGFQNYKRMHSENIPWRLLTSNLDADNFDELAAVYISPFAEGFVDVIHPHQNKTQRIYSSDQGNIVSAREAVLADQNGDGLDDLSILNWLQFDVAGGVLARHRNKGDGTFESSSSRPSRIGDLFITSGNFDGDRFEDIAMVGYIGEVVVLNGSGSQKRIRALPKNFRGEVQGLVSGDLNQDGDDDLVVAIDNELSRRKELRIAIANGDGSFQAIKRISLPYSEEVQWNLAVSDLNRDRKTEIILTTDYFRVLAIATYSNGALAHRPPMRVECNGLAVADIDGDLDEDIACAGSDIDQATIFRTSGSSFFPRITIPTPRFPVSIAAGDWNADRRPDLAVGFGKMYFPHLPNERNGLALLLQK